LAGGFVGASRRGGVARAQIYPLDGAAVATTYRRALGLLDDQSGRLDPDVAAQERIQIHLHLGDLARARGDRAAEAVELRRALGLATSRLADRDGPAQPSDTALVEHLRRRLAKAETRGEIASGENLADERTNS
ncbi:MAG: hypothetical protein AAGE94_01950, partial [Acidobacteriota bacterium]